MPRMPDMRQLEVLRDVLAHSDVQWWLDSGTLLGMIREGRLLESDHDLDFGVWRLNDEQIAFLKRGFGKTDHDVLLDYYQGEVFRLLLRPRNPNWRWVDVRIFREWNGVWAWSPRTQRRDYFAKWPAPLQKRARDLIRGAYLYWNYQLGGKAPRWAWPILDVVADTHCWWIPARFFRKTVILDSRWSVPELYEEYLTYRYGDWRTPVPNWKFKIDDPTYKKVRPELLFAMAAADGVQDTGTAV